jgi:hypothetical protein
MDASLVDSCEPDSLAETAVPRESSLVRGINRGMAHRSAQLGHPEPLMLFCECRAPACYAPLFVTLAAFDTVVKSGRSWLLRDGHESSAPSPAVDSSRAEQTRRTPSLESSAGRRSAISSTRPPRRLRMLRRWTASCRASTRFLNASVPSIRVES